MSERVVRHAETISLSDLSKDVVQDVMFVQCQFLGPGVIVATRCEFLGNFFTPPNQVILPLVQATDCVFERCVFEQVAMAGTGDQVPLIEAGFTLAESDGS
jgi:hypothetical protein